jgi:hypothetical protein
MATNAFSLMMGAARAIMKPIPPPAPAVDHVIQKKLGRPPTAKKTADLIPIAKNLSFNGGKKGRRGYNTGDEKFRMEVALRVLLKAKGKNFKRTSEVYDVSRKSLFTRYLIANDLYEA